MSRLGPPIAAQQARNVGSAGAANSGAPGQAGGVLDTRRRRILPCVSANHYPVIVPGKAASLMSTTPHATPVATARQELRIVSHSNLFYWWPVWVVGYVMA